MCYVNCRITKPSSSSRFPILLNQFPVVYYNENCSKYSHETPSSPPEIKIIMSINNERINRRNPPVMSYPYTLSNLLSWFASKRYYTAHLLLREYELIGQPLFNFSNLQHINIVIFFTHLLQYDACNILLQ